MRVIGFVSNIMAICSEELSGHIMYPLLQPPLAVQVILLWHILQINNRKSLKQGQSHVHDVMVPECLQVENSSDNVMMVNAGLFLVRVNMFL